MTQTFEDAAGRNTQARQPVIAPVQIITLDSDDTREKNAGLPIGSA